MQFDQIPASANEIVKHVQPLLLPRLRGGRGSAIPNKYFFVPVIRCSIQSSLVNSMVCSFGYRFMVAAFGCALIC